MSMYKKVDTSLNFVEREKEMLEEEMLKFPNGWPMGLRKS